MAIQQTFDEILDECLSMLRAGASVDECAAPYPEHAEELRADLQIARSIMVAHPPEQPTSSARSQSRARLLSATAEQARETADAPPTPWFLAPMLWFSEAASRSPLPAKILPATLGAILLSGMTLGALAAADAGGVRTAVTDAILRSSSDDDAPGDADIEPPDPDGPGVPDDQQGPVNISDGEDGGGGPGAVTADGPDAATAGQPAVDDTPAGPAGAESPETPTPDRAPALAETPETPDTPDTPD